MKKKKEKKRMNDFRVKMRAKVDRSTTTWAEKNLGASPLISTGLN